MFDIFNFSQERFLWGKWIKEYNLFWLFMYIIHFLTRNFIPIYPPTSSLQKHFIQQNISNYDYSFLKLVLTLKFVHVFVIIFICVTLRLNFFMSIGHLHLFSGNFFAEVYAYFPTEVFIHPVAHPLPASFNDSIRHTPLN